MTSEDGPPPAAARAVDEEGVARAAVHGVTWLAGERGVNQLVAAGVFLMLGRLLAPASFGLIAAANVVVLLFRVLVDGGFSRALIRIPELDEADVDTAFWTSLGIGGVMTVLAVGVSPLVATMFGEPRLQVVTVALSPLFLLAALDSTPSALVDRAMQFRVQAVRRTVATFGSAAAACAVALAGGGVWALVAQTLTYELLVVALLWPLTRWRPRRRWSRDRLRVLAGFGAGMTGIRLTFYLSGNADNLLIGVVLGPVVLGLYVVAYRIVVVLNDFTGITLGRVSLPVFSRYQGDSGRLQRAFLESCELGALAAFPLFGLLAVVGDRAVPLLFGSRWELAGPLAQALALAGAAQVPLGQVHNVVVAAGRIGGELRWTLASTLVLLGGFAATVRFGAFWVALSVGVTMLALLPVRIAWTTRQGLLPPRTVGRFYAALAGPSAAVAVMAVGVLLSRLVTRSMPSYAVVLVGTAVAVLVYLGALRLLAPGSWRLAVNTAKRLGGSDLSAAAGA